MIVKRHESEHLHLHGNRCARCGEPIHGWHPFIRWDVYADEERGWTALVFHETCAQALVLGLARDLHELADTRRAEGQRRIDPLKMK